MLAKFLTSGRKRVTSSLPSGMRVYAIGDVHGCADLLGQLLTMIDGDDASRGPADTYLIFLGDLVDRGPASAAVVEQVMALSRARPRVHLLQGNHEEVLLAAANGDAAALRMFCRIGGRETLLSYGVSSASYDRASYDELAEIVAHAIPTEHREFLAGAEDLIVLGDYAFVHAGVRPGVPLSEQKPADLRWIRETFLNANRPHEKRIVHGHTVEETVQATAIRIGIDTGAYSSGRLTALGLEGAEMWLLQTDGLVASAAA